MARARADGLLLGEYLRRNNPEMLITLVTAEDDPLSQFRIAQDRASPTAIIADGADVGIRLGESLDEHMVAVPITPRIEMAVVGSPDYFARHGTPRSPADLMQHNCLAYRFTSSGTLDRWSFTEPDGDGHTQVFEPRGSVVFNDDESMLKAAIQGVGLIKYLDICVREQLASGELVRVLQPWCQPFPGFYLYAPTRAQMPAKIRVLIDFLVEKRSLLD